MESSKKRRCENEELYTVPGAVLQLFLIDFLSSSVDSPRNAPIPPNTMLEQRRTEKTPSRFAGPNPLACGVPRPGKTYRKGGEDVGNLSG